MLPKQESQLDMQHGEKNWTSDTTQEIISRCYPLKEHVKRVLNFEEHNDMNSLK